MDWFSTLSLALGSAWTSGINLYATVTVLGLLQKFNLTKLPGGLDVLDNWWIIGVAGFLYAIEFFADKIPGVDSGWDLLQTVLRVPVGAFLAAATLSGDGQLATGALAAGGAVALLSHGLKSSTRVAINASPEPVTNIGASLTEDVVVASGIGIAFAHPWLALGLVFGTLLAMALVVAWIVRFILRKIRGVRVTVPSH